MQLIIGIFLFGLIAIAIIVLVIVNFAYKGIRQMREAAEETFARKQKQKEQKEKNPFGEDYFKSSDSGSRSQRQYQQTEGGTHQAKNTARRTTTSSGVTIIDDRNEDRKIFDSNDGEYVEFEEVK
jgi:hypothetical protein